MAKIHEENMFLWQVVASVGGCLTHLDTLADGAEEKNNVGHEADQLGRGLGRVISTPLVHLVYQTYNTIS